MIVRVREKQISEGFLTTSVHKPGKYKLVRNGGESGIRLPPSGASADEHYTSAIIPCVCAGYKRIRSWATVSIVSLIRCNSREKGITGISSALLSPERLLALT
jgi:hypothetical protein